MDRDAALDTYRYLRGGIPVMLVMLGIAIAIEVVRSRGWLTSISAYYYTSAHAVFIGSIFAMGALLIVYRGVKPTEDVLLNLAGTLAFVVALVPTTRPSPDVAVGVPVGTAADSTVIANTWALVAALLLTRVLSWVLYRRTATAPRLGGVARVTLWVQRVLFAIGLATLAATPRWFVANAHGIAATALFAAIVATVFLTAFVADKGVVDSPNPVFYQRIYRGVAISMAVTLVAAVVAHYLLDEFNHVVIVVEVVLLVEFFAYWAVQTVEKWNPPPDAAQRQSCTAREQRIINAL